MYVTGYVLTPFLEVEAETGASQARVIFTPHILLPFSQYRDG